MVFLAFFCEFAYNIKIEINSGGKMINKFEIFNLDNNIIKSLKKFQYSDKYFKKRKKKISEN